MSWPLSGDSEPGFSLLMANLATTIIPNTADLGYVPFDTVVRNTSGILVPPIANGTFSRTSPSKTITITINGHGFTSADVGKPVYFEGLTDTVGNIVAAGIFTNKVYGISSVIDANNYTITPATGTTTVSGTCTHSRKHFPIPSGFRYARVQHNILWGFSLDTHGYFSCGIEANIDVVGIPSTDNKPILNADSPGGGMMYLTTGPSALLDLTGVSLFSAVYEFKSGTGTNSSPSIGPDQTSNWLEINLYP